MRTIAQGYYPTNITINSSGIICGSYHRDTDSEGDHVLSTIIVNSQSINLTPFKTLRISHMAEFTRGSYWSDYYLNVDIRKTNKSTVLKNEKIWGTCSSIERAFSFDISGINEQAFLRMNFYGSNALAGSARFTKIEFLN